MDGYIGYITLFAGTFAPQNWAFCNGQVMLIQQNFALFSILGNTYGGDGTSTFALPNLQGRAVVGAGQGPNTSSYALGQAGGEANNVLNITQLPAHQHNIAIQITMGCGATVNSSSPENAVYGASASTLFNYTPNANLNTYAASITLGNSGGTNLVNTQRPILALNYIICLSGVFPQKPGN